MSRFHTALLGILGSVLVSGQSLAVTDISSCGQLLPAGEKGILQADLDCSGGIRVCIPPQ
jgi:hypothetical protein